MTLWKLIRRSLVHYRRTHVGVLAGAAIASAVLTGALLVGDCVRGSLRDAALARLGQVRLAAGGESVLFRAEVAKEFRQSGAPTAAVLALRGSARREDGAARVNRIQVIGADEHFWRLGPSGRAPAKISGEQVILNERLAGELDVGVGDEIRIRLERPSLLGRDTPLTGGKDASVGLTLTVAAVAADEDFGRFGLAADQLPPANAFVPLATLQDRLKLPGRANMLLVGDWPGKGSLMRRNDDLVRTYWRLEDGGLELRSLPESGLHELRSKRVFLPRQVSAKAAKAAPGSTGVLTYFVNEIRLGKRATPYSMVAGLGPMDGAGVVDAPLASLADDEIIINEWLAEDLAAKVGDEVTLKYYRLAPMRKLVEVAKKFRVRAILPMAGVAADRELMPAFPGLADVDNCRQWDSDLPIDLERIRAKDEDYWDRYGGAPKALVTLPAARGMWANRFGDLTAMRFTGPTRVELERLLRAGIDPADVGLFFRDVRGEALVASREGLDFGRLFLGLSMFLIVAAAVLVGLLFAFGIEQRSEEIGVLLAMGLPVRRVRTALLGEGALLAVIGSAIGAVGALAYTRGVLAALATVWSGAAPGASALRFHTGASSLLIGPAAAALIAMVTMWFALRRQLRKPARELLAGGGALGSAGASRGGRRWPGMVIAIGMSCAAMAILVSVGFGRGREQAGAFLAAGALLLAGGIAACWSQLRALGRSAGGGLTLARMGVRAAGRRVGRSVATITLLACGSFLIVAVAAGRSDPAAEAHRRDSGAGGFALVGESASAVYEDLNSRAGRRAMALGADELTGVSFVQLRLRDGDDASCLNLNRAQEPRLLGVRPADFAWRGAFKFLRTLDGADGWDVLKSGPGAAIPAVGDEATVRWGLGKGLGDRITYTDERGRDFEVVIAGIISNSVLQGGLLIDEGAFIERFPSLGGYRVLLIDAPADRADELAGVLSTALADYGLELTPAPRRLAQFAEVKNTYLSIFLILGGLGVLLGSAGVGVVAGRNVLERRGELALLQAVGVSRGRIRRMVLVEHWLLLALGLGCGVAAALVAAAPALGSAGVPFAALAVTLAAVVISGVVWTQLATMWAVRGSLLAALRSE